MLVARHIIFKLLALRTNVLSSSVLISSAFVATRRIQLPAAASKSASNTTTERTAATTAAPKQARLTTRAKKAAKGKAKQSLPRRVPQSERPPVRSPSAYILFFSRLAKTRKGEIKDMTAIQDLSKQAAAIWNNMTIAEKTPYDDEVEILKIEYQKSWMSIGRRRLRKPLGKSTLVANMKEEPRFTGLIKKVLLNAPKDPT